MLSLALPLALAAASPVQVLPSPEPVPRLDWNTQVVCGTLAPSKKVPSGRYRVQCTPQACLAAPNSVVLDGEETGEELSRVAVCVGDTVGADLTEWVAGRPVYEAVAEAPPGWYRDGRGRIMQVNFDLSRRVYFGGSWSPVLRPGGSTVGRGRAELGTSITWDSADGELQHRLHFLETEVWLGNDVRYDVSAARYDGSVRRPTPLLWLTTFVGTPRRFDLDLNLSWAVELLRFDGLGGKNFFTIGELDVVVDVWHSRDLDSYLRLRLGPALEDDLDVGRVYLRPTAAMELNVTLDRDGFHHLTGALQGEPLLWAPALDGRPQWPLRLKARVAYEVIVLAINDYPLSLVADLRAAWRDDVPALPGWDFQADVGLRFSFWAPARRSAAAVVVAGR